MFAIQMHGKRKRKCPRLKIKRKKIKTFKRRTCFCCSLCIVLGPLYRLCLYHKEVPFFFRKIITIIIKWNNTWNYNLYHIVVIKLIPFCESRIYRNFHGIIKCTWYRIISTYLKYKKSYCSSKFVYTLNISVHTET